MSYPIILRSFVAFSLSLCASDGSFAQLRSAPIDELHVRMVDEGKLTIAFFQTDWCSICHSMRQTTFKDPRVIEILNTHFLFIPFDAEQRQPIQYDGHTFRYRPNGSSTGMHEWAMELATVDGRVNFPTVTAFDAQHEILFQHPGLLNPDELLAVLEGLLAAEKP